MNRFPDPSHRVRENSCMHTKSAGGRVVRDVFWQQVRSKFWHCHKGRGSDPCQISLVDLKVKRYVMLES